MLASAVCPDGEISASSPSEIHTDRLGRIRIRFDFQDSQAQTLPAPIAQESSATSTWVRVMQRFAGAGMGWQLLPRVGQKVLQSYHDYLRLST